LPPFFAFFFAILKLLQVVEQKKPGFDCSGLFNRRLRFPRTGVLNLVLLDVMIEDV
jgi:hypothetical protein